MYARAIEQNDTSEAVLNMAILDQYRSRKNNLLERLIAAFLEEVPGFVRNIKHAGETGDMAAVGLNAHALRSCSLNLGAVRLANVCRGLEAAAVNNDADEVARYMAQIGLEWFDAEQALRGELYNAARTIIPQAGAQPDASRPWEEDYL